MDFPVRMKSTKAHSSHLSHKQHTFDYPAYTNSSLESSINKIKVVKRVDYGYRNSLNIIL